MSEIVLSHEQEKVLSVDGDILLSAGAGSGKTFMIIQYLKKIISNNLEKSNEDIQLLFAKICVITFTIKAARELKERVRKVIRSEANVNPGWLRIEQFVDHLFIGTIHSLCFQILKDKAILDSDIEIASNFQLKERVVKIFEHYCLNVKTESFLIENKKYVIDLILTVLQNPILRKNFGQVEILHQNFSKDFFKLFKIDFSSFSYFDTKWGNFVAALRDKLESDLAVKDIHQFLLESGNLPRQKKEEKSEGNLKVASELKKFKSELKKFMEVLITYEQNLSQIKSHQEIIGGFKTYLEKKYWTLKSISYSDLEYLMLKNEIESSFEFMIVDEYQDLSWVQFYIIESLSKSSLKLFVGDHKQAIYGFRGGEIDVYEKTKQKISHNLSLLDNYRSDREVINFNNALFENYLGDFEKQKAISEDSGKVQAIIAEGTEKYTSSELNKIEAHAIFEVLKKELEQNNYKTYAVIYKYLGPSLELFYILNKNEIPVKIDMKTSLQEEPLIQIFKLLLEYCLYQYDRSMQERALLEFQLLYTAFNAKNISHEDKFNRFVSQKKIYGFYQCFLNFLKDIGLYSSKSLEVLSLIKEVIITSSEIDYKIYKNLKALFSERSKQKIEIKKDESPVIEIISAHSSKGLEFDFVFLAGSMTNHRSKNHLENILESFHEIRYIDSTDKLVKQTPQYYIRKYQNKLKEESESNRLLYVAATRAKKYLGFFFLNDIDNLPASKSWAEVLRESIDLTDVEVQRYTLPADMKKKKSLPLFHVFPKISFEEETRTIGVLPELSVAKLSKVSLCPYKFYLEEVLKISEENRKKLEVLEIIKSFESEGISSAERGLDIHAQIEHLIKNLHSIRPIEIKDKQLKKIYNELVSKKDAKFFSEYDMRFKFFGYLISGRADLVIRSGNQLEVWDFKTGLDKDETSYFTQLMLYSYGYYYLNKLEDIKLIKNVIYYIDLDKVESKEYGISLINDKLLTIKDDLLKLEYQNLDYCHTCSMQKVCNPKTNLLS